MYLKLKADLGVGEFLILVIGYLMIMIGYGFIIVGISALISLFDVNIDFLILSGIVGGFLSPLLVLGLFIYTIKFVIDSIFIIPASDHEKKNLIESEKE